MEYSPVGLNDLPDEIILFILKKLNNIDVLYSLQGVNQRLNRIIQESSFTERLIFSLQSSNNIFIDRLSDNKILDRFCSQILPSIHGKIRYLALESTSMKKVLHATDYPNLYCITLFIVDGNSAQNLFSDEILSNRIFQNQIKKLNLACNRCEDYFEMLSSVTNIFEYIFPIFTKLNYLALNDPWYQNRVRLNFDDLLILNFRSSTLLYLKINVQSFRDCLYILDGRFNQLHTLIIDVVNPFDTQDVINRDHLPNLKYFSFTCNMETPFLNGVIPPLLYRMSNLERLGLYIEFGNVKTLIGRNYLKGNILKFMTKLNEFQFSITSDIHSTMQWNIPKANIFLETFTEFKTKSIMSYVDFFPKSNTYKYHIYSYPSQMIYYNDITNQFPGGFFQHVRSVSLFDEKPFEHEFFLQIQKSFPLMEICRVKNEKSQNCKESNENLSVIQYSFFELHIGNGHDDYIEEFLSETKTCFLKNINLHINYKSLERVTHNFTRENTRTNCTKVKKLYFFDKSKCSNACEEYFPNVKVFYP